MHSNTLQTCNLNLTYWLIKTIVYKTKSIHLESVITNLVTSLVNTKPINYLIKLILNNSEQLSINYSPFLNLHLPINLNNLCLYKK